MILKRTRDYATISVDGKAVTIWGETVYPPGRSACFATSVKTIKKWDDGQPAKPSEIQVIKQTLEEDFANAGICLAWDND